MQYEAWRGKGGAIIDTLVMESMESQTTYTAITQYFLLRWRGGGGNGVNTWPSTSGAGRSYVWKPVWNVTVEFPTRGPGKPVMPPSDVLFAKAASKAA